MAPSNGRLERLVMHQHLVADVVGQQAAQGREELVLVPGQEAAVDVGRRLTGDHVVLVAGLEPGRVGRVAQNCCQHAGRRPEVLDQSVGGLLGIDASR